MLIKLKKIVVFYLKPNFLKYSLINPIQRRFNSTLNEEIKSEDLDDDVDESSISTQNELKLLRIGIIGLPNVGKSTLINQLVGRPICAASFRPQTTRVNAKAVYVEGNTQLVFADTPGIVTNKEIKKFSLEKSFKVDAIESVKKVDLVGVVQDVSNKFTGERIDRRVLFILKHLKPGIRVILIMNKVDKFKRKRDLLNLTNVLTSEKNWPNFSDIFMVSALEADGIDDLRNYLIDSAKPRRKWEFKKEEISNVTSDKLIEQTIRAKFLDHLPQEMPYSIKLITDHFETSPDGTINSIVSVDCPTIRISKYVISKVRTVAVDSERELSNAFRTAVKIKLIVKVKNEVV